MSSLNQPAATNALGGEHVAQDQPCVRCRYNLRTLRLDAVCPECGTPVVATVRDQYLRYAPPELISRLSRGTAFLMMSMVLKILGWMALATLYMVMNSLFNAGESRIPQAFLKVGYVVLTAIFVVPWLWGTALLAAPLPRDARRAGVARAALGVTTLMLAAVLACDAVLLLAELLDLPIVPSLRVVWRQLSLNGDLLALAYGAALLMQLERLLRRLQRRVAAVAARTVLLALAVCTAMIISSWLLSRFAVPAATAAQQSVSPTPSLISDEAARRLRTIPYAGGVGASALPTGVPGVPPGGASVRGALQAARTLEGIARVIGYAASVGLLLLLDALRRALRETGGANSGTPRGIVAATVPAPLPPHSPAATLENEGPTDGGGRT
jgi:hypothetical protein